MKYLRLFGSAKKNIIGGIALMLLGISLAILADQVLNEYSSMHGALRWLSSLIYWAGLITIGVGIVMLGRKKGWWGRAGKQVERSIDNAGKQVGQIIDNEGAAQITLNDRDAKSLKIAATALGICGSVVTFFVSVFTVALGGLFSAITGEGIFVFIGWLVVLSSIFALVGAILTYSNPRVGAILLGIAAIPSLLFTFAGAGIFFGLGTLLLVIATVLAFIARTQERAASA